MTKLKGLKPERVFEYFGEISRIPRGSGNMEKISAYCVGFADKHSLRSVRDEANNVIIFKDGTDGYENAEPIILQGHLDMVCQKAEDSSIDFESDGLKLCVDGDFLFADGTTLGGDNGIAVAMILSILDSSDIPHPPIEAVFTTDEEIGMIGAGKLDASILKGKRMINIDAEEPDKLTVSCAGGSDFKMMLAAERECVSGTRIAISLYGLAGGHSGIEINSGRVNANILAGRVLNYIKSITDFRIIGINGGDKGNAIPNRCRIEIVANASATPKIQEYLESVAEEISAREGNFGFSVEDLDKGEYKVIGNSASDKLLFMLISAPNGVVSMSAEIENLVETSLNLGILKTEADKITLHFTLRSNKKSALMFLEEKLFAMAEYVGFTAESFGHYPPWEFKENSKLQKLYINEYKKAFGTEPEVVAIHAGLECGMFSDAIDGLDCIAIGPLLSDVHTTGERLSISSTEQIYNLLSEVLKNCME